MRLITTTLLASLITLSTPPLVRAQPVASGHVAAAQRLRDSGNFAGAVTELKAALNEQPDNGEAARLLAQTLYWLKDVAGARAAYADAVRRHPEDTTARLQYARMLAETGDRAAAREVALPLRDQGATRIEADALLGTIAYWDGDLVTARRFFEEVLQQDPGHADAQRQLQAIRSGSAPWIRLGATLSHDDQPLDRVRGGGEVGWWLTPLAPMSVRFDPIEYRLPNSVTRQMWTADASVSNYAPSAHLEMDLGGGVLQRTSGTDWHGHAGAGLRLGPNLAVRGRAERSIYLSTTSSISTPVIAQSITALAHWSDAHGWLGEGAIAHQQFEDSNSIASSYVWLLAPLVYRPSGELQLGYALSTGNADQSRFVLEYPSQPYQPSDPRYRLTGHYVPYYTPSNLVTHAAIGALAIKGPQVTFRMSGAAPLKATDAAPVFVVVSNQVQRTTFARNFKPWNGRASLEVTGHNGLAFTITGETGRTAFYSWASGEVALTYRFLPRVSVLGGSGVR